MKKMISLILVLAMMLSLAACGGSGTNAPADADVSAAESAAESAVSSAADSDSGDIIEGEKVNIVIGSVLNPGSPENIAMQWILDTLEEKTGGNITGSLYEGGSIGSETEMLEQCINGDCHITMTSLVGIDKYASAYNSISVPYLYSSKEQIQKSWDGKIGEAIREKFEEAGMYYDGIIFRGNRHLTANEKIDSPDKLKGLKLRLPDTTQWVTVWSGMGALPTPTSAAETFSALQTGVVDAQENNITSNYNKGMWEVQKYTMLTSHVVDTYIFCWSKDWFDGLSEDYQNLIRETILEAADYASDITAENEESLRSEMEANGMEFVDVDTAAFKEAALPYIQQVAEGWDSWVYDQAMEDTAE